MSVVPTPLPAQPAGGRGLLWIRWSCTALVVVGVLLTAIGTLNGDGPRNLLYVLALTFTMTGLGAFPWFRGLFLHPRGGLLFGVAGLALGILGAVTTDMTGIDWIIQGSNILVAAGLVVVSTISLAGRRDTESR